MSACQTLLTVVLIVTVFSELSSLASAQQGGRGGAGGAAGKFSRGGNGGNGGNNGGQGGLGGWGGPVSRGSDAQCRDIGNQNCPRDNRIHARMLPNPSDCGSFCSCSHGVGRFIPCPNGLHFSRTLQICTWPWEARC